RWNNAHAVDGLARATIPRRCVELVLARGGIADKIFVNQRCGAYELLLSPHSSEICRESPHILPDLFRSPKIDRIQVTGAVVTQQAIDRVDTQKHAREIDGVAIVCVLRRAAANNASQGPVRFALSKAVSRAGDQIASDLVVRLVARKRILDVEVKGIPSGNVPVDGR